MLARRSFAAEDFSEVVGALTPVLPSFTELYLSAVSDADVVRARVLVLPGVQVVGHVTREPLGSEMGSSWVLDLKKSLAPPVPVGAAGLGGGVHESSSWRRLSMPTTGGSQRCRLTSSRPQERVIQASPQSRLLEAYRQVRNELSAEDMDTPVSPTSRGYSTRTRRLPCSVSAAGRCSSQ